MVHNPEEFQAGLFARDAGIARAERGASADWLRDAERAVYDLAHRVEKFTSEDVRDLLRTWAISEPTEVRALGGVMRRVAAAGAIETTGETRRYTRRSRHTGTSYVWRSLLHGKVL